MVTDSNNSNNTFNIGSFNKSTSLFDDYLADKKLVIFGTGKTCSDFLSKFKVNVEYFLDNDKSRWNESVFGRVIHNPEILYKEKLDNIFIFVASMYYSEISRQLEDMGLVEDIHFNSTYDIEKSVEFKKYFHKDIISGNEYVFPRKMRLEASTVCQLSCPACPAGGQIRQIIGNGFLKFENFRNLIDRNPWIKEIELSSKGEIFLNPEILKIIEYSYLKDIQLTADSGVNLNTVSEEVLEGLVKYKFKNIVCSIDGASNDTYALYRVNGNYDKVISNIKRINEYKRLYNSEYPYLNWQFIIFGHNEHEIRKARELAEKLNMIFTIKLNYSSFSPIRNIELVREQLDEDFAITRQEYNDKNNEDYECACYQLWKEPQINWNGELLGCCVNCYDDFGVNVFNYDLLEAINSDNMLYARKMLSGKAPGKDGIPCSKCFTYLKMKENQTWIR